MNLIWRIRMTFLLIAVSASGIMHALNNMKHQEQNGNFHPPRREILEGLSLQSHNQIQVSVISL